jgi:hypothetical protein
MTSIPKLFAVEYSIMKNATYVCTLDAMLKNNRQRLLAGKVSDYVPIGLFDTRDEADKFIVAFQPTLDEQAQVELHRRDWRHISDVLDKLLPKDFEFVT